MKRYEEAVALKDCYPQYKIGEGTYGGLNIYSWGDVGKAEIGAYCSFGFGCTAVLGGNHRADWATTFPFTALWPEAPDVPGHPLFRGDIIIGNDVWFGIESMVLSGVTIGDGAVIAARSTVTKDVEPYEIVGGSPAKHLGRRFDDNSQFPCSEIRRRLLEVKWWDWPKEKIVKALPLMLSKDIVAFLDWAEKQ